MPKSSQALAGFLVASALSQKGNMVTKIVEFLLGSFAALAVVAFAVLVSVMVGGCR